MFGKTLLLLGFSFLCLLDVLQAQYYGAEPEEHDTTGDAQAILIIGSGGWTNNIFQGPTTAELYYRNGTKLCSLPNVPSKRLAHSLNGVTVCGGETPEQAFHYILENCLTLRNRQWVPSHHLRHKRRSHVSWTRDNEIILIGGWDSKTSSEILRTDSSVTNAGFNLKYSTVSACGISVDSETYIITGGRYTMNTVTKYMRNGNNYDMPNLNTGRRDHACQYFHNSFGEKVYLVTGGRTDYSYISSTEILTEGADRWYIAGHLPHAMGDMGAVRTLDNNIIVAGGWDSLKEYYNMYKDILKFDTVLHTWTKIGSLTMARYYHDMSVVKMTDVIDNCIN